MSDKHDHTHDHHGHEHAHDHDHGNGGGQIKLSAPRVTVPDPAPLPEHPQDDAGSTALSEALRSSFFVVKIVMVILVIAFFGSGLFTVTSQQRAIVLRFGKPTGTGPDQLLGPGLHWSWPSPIDEVVKISIGDIKTVQSTTGWYQTTPE